jgi:hypothetical protein
VSTEKIENVIFDFGTICNKNENIQHRTNKKLGYVYDLERGY